MKSRVIALTVACVLAFLTFAGCAPSADPPAEGSKLRVICTLFAPYDFAKQVAGDMAQVSMLLPPGVESHSYDPTPKDIINIENADVFFYVSRSTETWVGKILDSVDAPDLETVDMAEDVGIELHDHHHEDEEHGEHEEETDEHIWTNPVTAVKMVRLIEGRLARIDPENASAYIKNGESYIARIKELDRELRQLVARSKRREIVSGSRFAMKNFTEEYGLEYTAAFDSCVDNTEPSAAVMGTIIDKIRGDNIPVIFYEELTDPKIARSVSRETGAKMLLLHSCHNVSADEFKRGETYLSLMRRNYLNLKEALN